MAVTQEDGGDAAEDVGETGVDARGPRYCESAEEYVVERLESAEEPLTPAELAAEYECSNNHMRHTLSDLAQEGVAERVSRGNYVLADEDASVDDLEDDDGDVEADVVPIENMSQERAYQRQHGEEAEEEANDDRGEEHAQAAAEGGENPRGATSAVAGLSPGHQLVIATAVFAIVVLILYLRDGSDGADDGADEEDVDDGDDGISGEIPLMEGE